MPAPRQWTHDEDKLLGRLPDKEVAGRLGIDRGTVRRRRRVLGIPVPSTWRRDEDAVLGVHSDIEVARRLDRTVGQVSKRRLKLGIAAPMSRPARRPYEWTADAVELLGEAPDHVVAELLGCSEACVWRKRQRLGIPPFRPEHNWRDEEIRHAVASRDDAAVAAITGTSRRAVSIVRCRYRHKTKYRVGG